MTEYSDSLTRALLAEEAARPQPKPVRLKDTDPEPPEGSVLMIESTTGTAVQRFYSDGLYHATTGATFTYEALFHSHRSQGTFPREVYLVYRAPEED